MRVSLCAALVLAACQKESPPAPQDTAPDVRDVAIQFRALFGNIPFECHNQAQEIGTAVTTVRPTDMRMYVHDVTLTDAESGEAVPVALVEGTPWSGNGLTLLDFESGEAFCAGGTAGINTVVAGTVPGGRYSGVSFKIGVPFEMDHQALETAPPPLDVAGMFVNPITGWHHFSLGISPQVGPEPTWPVQIHAVNCTPGTTTAVSSCAADNVVTWSFPEFAPDDDTIDVDLKNLLATTNLTSNASVTTPGGVTHETPEGCQADVTDPDCKAIFTKYGLTALEADFISVK